MSNEGTSRVRMKAVQVSKAQLSETAILNTIDALDREHETEEWLAVLYEQDRAGVVLRRLAEEKLTKGTCTHMIAELRKGTE